MELTPTQKHIVELSLESRFDKIDLTMQYTEALEIIDITKKLCLSSELTADLQNAFDNGRAKN